MRKLLRWLDKKLASLVFSLKRKNILKIGIAFLLFFIPLYPKLPLIDVEHTWVYVRLEDFFIAFLTFIFFIQLVRKKVTFKTPLSFPIFLYWLVGGMSLLYAVIFLQFHIPIFFPSVAFLHFARRIEYMILFFITFSTIKNVKDVYYYLTFFATGVAGVILYGFGQKFLGFPAFLTMNEEFAKGVPLFLPSEARMTSTFAGHYDLAAYLVFVLALFGSLIFGVKKRSEKLGLFFVAASAYILLLFTASRISFAVYLVSITLVLFLQKRKWLIVPVILISIFLMIEIKGVSVRLGKTFRVEQVVYDVRTGRPIATLEDFLITPTPSVPASAEIAVKKIPPEKEEELPLGSGFLEVPLLEKAGSPSASREIKTIVLKEASEAAHLATISGEFLVKRAIVYDIAFTTRFQGTWPRAIKAFKRNIFLGSGYSSISLATDNSYLRALGETGILGLTCFLFILFIILLITRQSLRKMRFSFNRSVVIGISSGIFGLSLNALLVDIFEASKVAYILWMMVGIMVGLFSISVKKKESLIKEGVSFLKEPMVAIVLLVLATALIFSSAISNYFTADDFTWLRWAAKTKSSDIPNFFLDAKGFFYRPLIKIIFYVGHLFLGLKPEGYHLMSFILHFLNSTTVYFVALLLSESCLIGFLSGLFFLLHPIHAETIFWISSYSGLFTALFYFLSFYLFLGWTNEKCWTRPFLYFGSLLFFSLSLASYELAVTLPLVLLLYLYVYKGLKVSKAGLKELMPISPYFAIFTFYIWLRNFVARAHFLSGDYRYNMGNFVFNFFGNTMGYLGELIVGFHFIPLYDFLRRALRSQRLISSLLVMIILSLVLYLIKRLQRAKIDNLRIFSLAWITVTLLPVIGLGNIAERYLYIPSLGFVIFISTLIHKLYRIFLSREKGARRILALSLVLILIISISGLYYLGIKRAELTWREAGETSNKILRALSTNYREFPHGSTLYFVSLPLRVERAWIFPVGLEDGLWFIYKDESLKIKKGQDLKRALDFKEKNKNVYVFVYQDGKLKEATRL